jgi:uncharacterized protein YegL
MYQNEATSNSQALIVFLLDVSGTMGKPMGEGQTRIQVVQNALKITITEMVQRSLKNKELRPRYRIAMIAYSDKVYDILQGVKPIDFVAQKGIPKLEPLNRTDMTQGLYAVKQLLEQEKKNITKNCPAPLVIHMTDGEFTSKEDPERVIREIQNIKVDDGSVLVENLFVSDDLKVSIPEATKWPGYGRGDDLGNPYANRLLSFSSPLPEMYRTVMSELGYSIQPNTAMMYPGIKPEFVQMAFVMSTVSAGAGTGGTKKWEDDPE